MSASVLEVKNLKREVGGRLIVSNTSFSLRQGEVLFLRGPSGVGKSLLLRALAYLDPIQVVTLGLLLRISLLSCLEALRGRGAKLACSVQTSTFACLSLLKLPHALKLLSTPNLAGRGAAAGRQDARADGRPAVAYAGHVRPAVASLPQGHAERAVLRRTGVTDMEFPDTFLSTVWEALFALFGF